MMTTEIALNAQTSEIAQPTETIEITDAALITKAKGLNRSIDKYVHKGIEAFWSMGEALGTLYKRRHLHADGKWESILKEIGVSGTTDRNARRFYESCEFADLHMFKNKTDGLRKLGIIATPLADAGLSSQGLQPRRRGSVVPRCGFQRRVRPNGCPPRGERSVREVEEHRRLRGWQPAGTLATRHSPRIPGRRWPGTRR